MIKLVVAAILLVIIMIVFVFVLFKNLIKRINQNAKTFFVNKMQNYDYILEEKQTKLEELTKEIENIEEKISIEEYVYKDEEENYKLLEKSNDTNINYNLNVPKYRESQFFKNYKEIKKLFSVNNEEIIRNFISEHRKTKENTEYKKLKAIRDKFGDNAIYECLTLDKKLQIEILKESLTDAEKKLINLDNIINKESFNIKDFIKYIDERIESLDQTIYIYINGNSNGYENIDKNIVVEQYKNISEGIIIKFRNKIYDYSI